MSSHTGSAEFQYSTQPEPGELVSQMIGLSGVTIMSVLFGIKTYNIQYFYLSYSKWLVLLLYVCSLAFTFSGLHLVFTNNGNYISCLLSILACDIFYSGTKIIIYCWLIEKVWVVNAGRTTRWQTKLYRFHVLLLTPYVGILSLMILYHNAWLEKDGICTIGLQLIATVPLLLYDFIFNLYMTILFVRPLFKIDKVSNTNDQQTTRLKEVAKRTMVASVVCLIVSFANVAALTILNGVERGAVCLTCCYMDVMINVVTVHWVTSQPSSASKSTQAPLSHLNKNKSQNSNNNITLLSSNQTQTIGSMDTKKKKNIKHDSINEQYGEFGNHHHWPTYADHPHPLPTSYYMSATNTNIITSAAVIHDDTSLNYPPVMELSHSHYPSTTNNNTTNTTANNNGRYIMISEKEEDDIKENFSRSRSSSIQESYSSKQSLTKTNLN